jgi:chemotaxis protein methyltransferase CheR
MVYGRLARRIRALGLNSFAEYCELLSSDKADGEIGNLVNAITTNLTSFFREPHHFTHLRNYLQNFAKNPKNSRKIRLWSSASSSGMEPYSMAMTLRAAIPEIDKWDAKILATDIDTNMVATGARGEYSFSDLKTVPENCKGYIDPATHPDKRMMSVELKRLISFKSLNLLEDWPMKGPFQIIFCRNVVIYFDKQTKQKLFDRMADIIDPNGFLYIGHSENLNGITDRFELVDRTTYRRIK